MMTSPLRSPQSFRTRLTWLIVGAVSVIAVASALISTTLISKRIDDWVIRYAHTTAQHIATGASFAFIAGDADAAANTLSSVAAFPGVLSAAFVAEDGTVFARAGAALRADSLSAPQFDEGSNNTTLTKHPAGQWDLWTVVLSDEATSTPFGDAWTPATHLGWVYIQWNGALVSDITWLILVLTLGVAALTAVVVGWLVRVMALRMTQPLSDLSALMLEEEHAADLPHAPVTGARELQEMATAYNAMVNSLRAQAATIAEQTEHLESEVTARTAELENALKRTEAMVGTLSHDMRTPVHSIMGYLRLGREELVHLHGSTTLEANLDLANQASQVLLRRLQNVLELAQLQAGAQRVKYAPVDVSALMRRLETIITPLARERDNVLTVKAVGNVWPTWSSDEEKIERILHNLVSNACKFTHTGEVTVEVAWNDAFVEFVVSDTGPGISPKRCVEIFQPFCKKGQRSDPSDDGIGLGLSITKGLCELLGGTVTVQSEVGVGTEFRVALPRRPGKSRQPPASLAS